MKTNLDALKSEIPAELAKRGLIIFHSYSVGLSQMPELKWDARKYGDYKPFLDVAQELGAKLVAFHHHELDSDLVESTIDDLPSAGLDFDDVQTYERRLRELSVYEGFVCSIELSFDAAGVRYIFAITAPWYDDLMSILDELDLSEDMIGDEDEDEPYGGYYSKN